MRGHAKQFWIGNRCGRGCCLLLMAALVLVSPSQAGDRSDLLDVEFNAIKMLIEGRQTFRHDSFGNQAFWGGQLRLHEAIAGEANGGVGPGLSPVAALELGLKVDVRALSPRMIKAARRGRIDLDDPAVTLELLRRDAIVGIQGFFEDDQLVSVGITCALCHSAVDDSLAEGAGRRLDGWANRDLNVGAIISISPSVAPFAELLQVDESTVRTVFRSWGPGKFDASLLLDGKAFRPDGGSAAVLIPPAFGLAGVNLHTWTGWGSVTHWNALVAVLEMQGQGRLFDPRLNDAEKFPIAAANGFADVRREPDLVTGKLEALHFYQLALPAPAPPRGSFDPDAAKRGEALFNGRAGCSGCHVPPIYTEPGYNLHAPEDIGIDAFQANRSPAEGYRTSPLKGLWTHTKGGFYHDGRFETLDEVIEHYSNTFGFVLSSAEQADLIEFLLSL